MSNQIDSALFIGNAGQASLAVTLFLSVTCSILPLSSNVGSGMQQSNRTGNRRAIVEKSRANTAVAVTAIRNLDDAEWLERLEIEVKNISAKPIFCLQVVVGFPGLVSSEVTGVTRMQVIPLSYGRRALLQQGNLANVDDPSIKPGENHVFKIPEQYREGLENRIKLGTVSEAAVSRIGITVDSLSFGDGTGFRSGIPFSFPRKNN